MIIYGQAEFEEGKCVLMRRRGRERERGRTKGEGERGIRKGEVEG